MTHRRFPFSRAVLLAGVAIVAGCTVGPDFLQPAKPQEQGFTPEPLALQTASVPDVHGGAAQTFEPGRDIPGDWWTLFGSEELTALVREALSANPDIDAAQATLRQANETLYAQQGALFPSLAANGSGTQQQTTGAAQGLGVKQPRLGCAKRPWHAMSAPLRLPTGENAPNTQPGTAAEYVSVAQTAPPALLPVTSSVSAADWSMKRPVNVIPTGAASWLVVSPL